ncbi:MAG TPA: glycosyltransferase family 4 protein, partial [Chitinophagaceae bacterium]|nr:glycosyltransferase family 4 protein [Chitinophagaceae bacterium]
SDCIGGATKVNVDILNIFLHEKPVVVFSKKYKNNAFARYFQQSGVHIIDLRNRVDNKILYIINIIYRGILSAWINQAENPVVFGGESIYFYKVIPYLKKNARVIELLHLSTWLNYNQAFVKHIDVRISSTPKLKRDIEAQYAQNGVPEKYFERLLFIDNWVDIPVYRQEEHQRLNVLFVGRGSPQKRVHLVSQIADKIMKATDEITFTFVGDVSNLVSDYTQKHAKLYGNVSDGKVLSDIYETADILILTSAYEGLPIVVMDMMARGKLVLSTAVDGIPDYVRHRDTGLLLYEVWDENKLVEEAASLIYEMNTDRNQLKQLGERAFLFAREHFLKANFEQKYSAVFARNRMEVG